jgi:tRNA A22 N-methylase
VNLLENLIREIIELDKKKRMELKELENQKNKIGSFLREKRQEIEFKYQSEADEKLNQRKSEIESIISEAKKQTKTEYKNSLKKLDETFSNHHQEWIDTLYQYCVSDDAEDETS